MKVKLEIPEILTTVLLYSWKRNTSKLSTLIIEKKENKYGH